MKYFQTHPDLILSPYIKQFWSIEDYFPEIHQNTQRVIPTGMIELSFYLDGSAETNNMILKNNIYICGQKDSYYDLTINSKISIFSILFKPEGAKRFFDFPFNELFNISTPLDNFMPRYSSELEERLYQSNSFPERVKIAESFLFKQLKRKEISIDMKRINFIINMINNNSGNISISELAGNSCLSQKQFERVFKDQTGISPKAFAKIVRFQKAISLMQNKLNDTNLTGIAYDCGYFDQSHMTNEFKKLSGMSPKTFFNECNSYSDYF